MRNKVLFDTNILVSAALNPVGLPSQAFHHALDFYDVCLCTQNLEELRDFSPKKAGKRFPLVQSFTEFVEKTVTIVPIPKNKNPLEEKIRDVNDRPILRAAIYAGVDIILTGDRDFLESGIESPRIMTASDFLDL